jgi:hypothetical protein
MMYDADMNREVVTGADGERTMVQMAPWPSALEALVSKLRYKVGWRFNLLHMDRGQGCRGLTLQITVRVSDSYDQERMITVAHYMPVPPAAYDARSWQRWLFDQIELVERHEICEAFRFVVPPVYNEETDTHHVQPDYRPYAPSHGPGNNPYLVRELGTDEDRRTSFRGELS